jgi:hypothetical protein
MSLEVLLNTLGPPSPGLFGGCRRENRHARTDRRTKSARIWCGDPATAEQLLISCCFPWWARQRPYKAAFPEGFRGLIERLNRRVPTKIPTKLPRGRRSVCRPYVQSSAALRSNYQGSLMAISRKNILEVDPGTRRPMADGAVNQLITRRGLDRDRIRLSRRRRSRSQSGWNTSSRAWKINLAPGEACDRPGFHPFRSAGGAVSETRQGRQRKTTSSCRT